MNINVLFPFGDFSFILNVLFTFFFQLFQLLVKRTFRIFEPIITQTGIGRLKLPSTFGLTKHLNRKALATPEK